MDIDGGVFIHKYIVIGKRHRFNEISFSNRSISLLMLVVETLSQLGFDSKIIDKVENKKVWLYNQNEVNRYLNIVGSYNLRLLKLIGG